MKKFWWIVSILPRLGLLSVLRNVTYRLLRTSGFYRAALPSSDFDSRDIFIAGSAPGFREALFVDRLQERANGLLKNEFVLFSHIRYQFAGEVDWHRDVVHDVLFDRSRHFSDVVLGSGDIKCVWELSRFEWALLLARAYRSSGDENYLTKLNQLTNSWLDANPPYQGVNWFCGQETAIRLVNILLCWFVLGRQGSPGLVKLVRLHLERINLTLMYAISQNNNHGTSETAGLFIGGCWLRNNAETGDQNGPAERYIEKGRKGLEERVRSLVFSDGGFSQYSTNYHRVLLDTLSQVEFWRLTFDEPEFSQAFNEQYRRATYWLEILVAGKEGETLNLGANDGARLFDLSDAEYSDVRPTLELAGRLSKQSSVFPTESSNRSLAWLDLNPGASEQVPGSSELFRDFGLVILKRGELFVSVRFANFRYRPSQADCLHVDVFYKGRSIARDLGSYSYHHDEHEFFSGNHSHNTISFAGTEQMPRIGQFLFGAWLTMDSVGEIRDESEILSWRGSFTDFMGNSQTRTVSVSESSVVIRDEIAGASAAQLRWNLEDDCTATESSISGLDWTLTLENSGNIILQDGVESRKYLQKSPIKEMLADIVFDHVTSTFLFR